MSDFLARLSQRTLGVLPGVQPMLPSLYEQYDDEPGDAIEVSDEVERGPVQRAPRGAVGRASSTGAPRPEVPTRAKQASDAPETVMGESKPRAEAPEAPFADPGAPGPLGFLVRTPLDAAPASARRSNEDVSRVDPTAAPAALAGDPADEILIDPTLAPLGRRAPRGAASDPEMRAETAGPVPSDEPHQAEALGRRQPSTLVVGSRRREYPRAAGPDFAAASPAEPAVIRVTIGRIDVRAAEASPSSARTAAAAPALSLDEYLKRTNGQS